MFKLTIALAGLTCLFDPTKQGPMQAGIEKFEVIVEGDTTPEQFAAQGENLKTLLSAIPQIIREVSINEGKATTPMPGDIDWNAQLVESQKALIESLLRHFKSNLYPQAEEVTPDPKVETFQRGDTVIVTDPSLNSFGKAFTYVSRQDEEYVLIVCLGQELVEENFLMFEDSVLVSANYRFKKGDIVRNIHREPKDMTFQRYFHNPAGEEMAIVTLKSGLGPEIPLSCPAHTLKLVRV